MSSMWLRYHNRKIITLHRVFFLHLYSTEERLVYSILYCCLIPSEYKKAAHSRSQLIFYLVFEEIVLVVAKMHNRVYRWTYRCTACNFTWLNISRSSLLHRELCPYCETDHSVKVSKMRPSLSIHWNKNIFFNNFTEGWRAAPRTYDVEASTETWTIICNKLQFFFLGNEFSCLVSAISNMTNCMKWGDITF